MTANDIKTIEAALGITVPEYYRTTMLAYPFPANSFADQFMLPNSPTPVLDNNQEPGEYPGIGSALVIGGDGGEETYFIDVASGKSQVFVYDMETGKHALRATEWAQYLDQVSAALREIEEDERAETERKANKKWWEFWK